MILLRAEENTIKNFFTFKLYPHIDIHILQMAATTWWLTNKKLSLSINNFTTNLYNITFLFISPN